MAICFVLGLFLGTFDNSSAPLLSSKSVHLNLRFAQGIDMTVDSSIIIRLIGTNSLTEVDHAIYSASLVLRDISICNLLAHAIWKFE